VRLFLSSAPLGDRSDALLAVLRGGRRTAFIANAADYKSPDDRQRSVRRDLDDFARRGLEPLEVDLREHFGDAAGLRERLASVDLIWARGGNAFILRRAFRASGADTVVHRLLSDDAVAYGGYSAGVSILCPSLHGVELVDDPALVPAGYEGEIVWDGLGVLPYKVVPHYRSSHPESADVERVVEYLTQHHTPFVALRDGTAIVRDGARERVVAV